MFDTQNFLSLNPTTVKGARFRSTDNGNGFGIICTNKSSTSGTASAYFGVKNAAQIVGDLGVVYATGGKHNFLVGTGANIITRFEVTSTGAAVTGALSISGSLSKGSGSFKIDHPLKPDTHYLVHSFIEGPQADLIYRGQVKLVNGRASINIDSVSRMTEGTFNSLCRNVQCFTTNETGWSAVRGNIEKNLLTIIAQDETCTDTISWMIIGERKDKHILDTDWTDDTGRVITEPEKDLEKDIIK